MPARKSHEGEEGATMKDGTSVEDLLLPRTMCQRLAKGVLPANTQIQKDALLAMSKSATVFINYISMHAQDAAQAADKSTIRPKDVLEAVKELEFDDFIPRLEIELEKYNTEQCNKRNTYRRQKREEKAAADVKAATQAAMSASQASRDAGSGSGTEAAANGDLDDDDRDDTLGSSDAHIMYGSDGARDDADTRPPSKKVRVSGATNGAAVGLASVSALEDEGEEDDDDEGEEGAGDGDEDGDEGDEGDDGDDDDVGEEELREDPLEEVEGAEEDEEDEALDGEESD